MKTFSYVLSNSYETVCGVVNANTFYDAETLLKRTYEDYYNFEVNIEEIDTKAENTVTEFYYGG